MASPSFLGPFCDRLRTEAYILTDYIFRWISDLQTTDVLPELEEEGLRQLYATGPDVGNQSSLLSHLLFHLKDRELCQKDILTQQLGILK